MAAAAPIIGEAPTRWSGPHTASRLSAASLGAAMLLHLAAGWLLPSFVRIPTTSSASEDQVVALIFAPAPAPHAVPPPVLTVAVVTNGAA
jgi:hypothetical protein